MADKLLIIGGNAAGLAAALAARRRAASLDIQVLESGWDFSFGACGMPYNLADPAREPDDLLVRGVAAFQEKGIRLAPGHRVAEVDPEKGRLRLTRQVEPGGRGEELELAWDRLVVACGSRPRELVVPGLSRELISHFKSLDDLRQLKERLPDLRRVGVAGAGLIGIELTEALHERGIEVVVVDPQPRPLAGFPAGMRDAVLEELAGHGVTLRLGCRIASARVTGTRFRLQLESVDPAGTALEQVQTDELDLLLNAAGQRPATDFLPAALLDSHGLLRVDEGMRSAHPRIWAAGDCVARRSVIPPRPGEVEWVWNPQAREALQGGRVAGWNAAGDGAGHTLPPGTQTMILRCFNLDLARCGRWTPEDQAAGELATAESPDRSAGREVRGLLGMSASWPTEVRSVRDAASSRDRVIQQIVESRTRGHAMRDSGRLDVWLEADSSGVLRGGAILATGGGGALRINTLAALLQHGARAEDLAALDLAYSPPFGPLVDPLIVAAERLARSIVKKSSRT